MLQDFHQHHHHDEEHVEVECYEECQQESGSPCTSGGLHMPNSQSMRDFARQVNRLRYYSYNQGNEAPIGEWNRCLFSLKFYFFIKFSQKKSLTFMLEYCYYQCSRYDNFYNLCMDL